SFGMLWEANDWLTLGFSYKSESVSDLEGDYSMEYTSNFVKTMKGLQEGGLDAILPLLDGGRVNATDVEKGTVKTEYIVPQTVSFGASLQVMPDLKVNLDAKWIEYSRWDELTFSFSQNNDFLTLASVINTLAGLDYADPDEMRIPRKYEDTWSWAIGAEYQWNDNIVLRAGYEPRSSAIPEDRSDLLFPIGDADLFTAGFGWRYDNLTQVEAAIGYMHSNTKTDACESLNANSCREGDVVYNPYFATPFENEVNAYLVALSIDRKF
ncbi:MAG: OmpP1/FadL family transporter, partial [Ketobacter sp.]